MQWANEQFAKLAKWIGLPDWQLAFLIVSCACGLIYMLNLCRPIFVALLNPQ